MAKIYGENTVELKSYNLWIKIIRSSIALDSHMLLADHLEISFL